MGCCRTAKDEYIGTGLLFQCFYVLLYLLANEGSIRQLLTLHGFRQYNLVCLIIPCSMFNIMLAGIGFVTGCRPVAFHHLPCYASIQGGISTINTLTNMIKYLLIYFYPIHFAV